MSNNFFYEGVLKPTAENDEFVNYVSSSNFPLYCQPIGAGNHFLFAHAFMMRHEDEMVLAEGKINSTYYVFAKNVFDEFCKQNNISYKTILRSALNCTTYCEKNLPQLHRDHPFEHKVFLMYLNDCEGETLIYDESGKQISHRIKPQKYKCVIFSGELHTNLPPDTDERRLVLVKTFV